MLVVDGAILARSWVSILRAIRAGPKAFYCCLHSDLSVQNLDAEMHMIADYHSDSRHLGI